MAAVSPVIEKADGPLSFSVERAGFTVRALLERQNGDVLLQLVGGDVPHYGVVTMVDKQGKIITHAFPSRPGRIHQEGVLSEAMAREIAPVLQGTAVIVSGVHVNEISKEQMSAAVEMTATLAGQVRSWLVAHPVDVAEERFHVSEKVR